MTFRIGFAVFALSTIALLGCNIGDSDSAVPIAQIPSNTTPDAGDSGVDTDLSDVSNESDVPDATDEIDQTQDQLNAFFDANGGRAAFPEAYVSIIETLLLAEDDVVAHDYAKARQRIDALLFRYPLNDPAWWDGTNLFGLNVGTPVGYYGIRMLSDLANFGIKNAAVPVAELEPLQLTVVVVTCAQGTRPANRELTESESVTLTIDPRLAADNYVVIHQSLRLFSEYTLAITQGRRNLVTRIVEQETCADVQFSAIPNTTAGVSGIADASRAALQATRDDTELRTSTDLWWVIYPSNVPTAPVFADAEFVTGGMGLYGDAALFIVDDLWLLRTPPHLGNQVYDDVQRRVYLPQWLQHEFFHHLFRAYPALGLEAAGHQWFDRDTWPSDFVGSYEPDYYSESLNKRFQDVDPPLWETLRTRPLDVSALVPADFVGAYKRLPVENGYHEVGITFDGTTLTWANAANVAWPLFWANGLLQTDATSPYGDQDIVVKAQMNGATLDIQALNFLGEDYVRQ
jgi:hypothetical protein